MTLPLNPASRVYPDWPRDVLIIPEEYDMPRRPNITRTPERLIRLAYDLEALAARLRANGLESAAADVLDLSSRCGKVGRSLSEKVIILTK